MTTRTRAQLWDKLRLLVIDLETAVAPDKKTHRIISVAAVTCVGGKLTEEWSSLVNPGVPIDPETQKKHRLTDDDVKDAPPFALVAPVLAPLLVTRRDEVLVIVAHNTHFDIPILRDELGRLGETITDLPVIDTMGRLPALAGAVPAGRKLGALAAVLGLTNAAPHTALGDAKVTAEAVCKLLDMAADAGHTDLAVLLADLASGRTVDLLRATPRDDDFMAEPDLPPEHIASHSVEAAPGKARKAVTVWLDSVVECATLLCPSVGDRVDEACPLRPDLFTDLTTHVVALAKSGNRAATATVLGALMPHFGEIPPLTTGRREQAQRNAALVFDAEFGPLADGLRRCFDPFFCPACRSGLPCSLDVWRLSLASVVIGDPDSTAKNFFWTTGATPARQVWGAMRTQGHPDLADAALRLVYRHWVAIGQRGIAANLAGLAVNAGCRDPEIAEAHAITVAAGGRAGDLDTALAVCDAVLAVAGGSAEEGWVSLAVRRAEIGGRVRRLADKERHSAKINVRVRPPRFQRAFAPVAASEPEISAE